MAENTPNSFLPLGNTTEELAGLHGKEKQFVVDTTKNTLVVMDGTTLGGHPLAKEGTKIKSGSEDVIVNDGTEATLAGDVTIKNKPWGIALEGGFPDDPEEEAAIAERLPVGGFVTGLIPNGPEDAIPAPYNTEEIITESGTWTAPVSAWYEVTCIGGGGGSGCWLNILQVFGGGAGSRKTKLLYLEKGTQIPVSIGIGGTGTAGSPLVDIYSTYGGETSFGDISSLDIDAISWDINIQHFQTEKQIFCSGLGPNGARAYDGQVVTGYNSFFDGKFPGGGASAVINLSDSSSPKYNFGNGAPGAVILRWYDPAKDTHLSIGYQLVTDLVARIAALEAKIKE